VLPRLPSLSFLLGQSFGVGLAFAFPTNGNLLVSILIVPHCCILLVSWLGRSAIAGVVPSVVAPSAQVAIGEYPLVLVQSNGLWTGSSSTWCIGCGWFLVRCACHICCVIAMVPGGLVDVRLVRSFKFVFCLPPGPILEWRGALLVACVREVQDFVHVV
jgi:hypothetical protein